MQRVSNYSHCFWQYDRNIILTKKILQKKSMKNYPACKELSYPLLTLYLLVLSATVWTQIRPDKMSGLIWIKIVWHSDGIPERIFQKSWFLTKGMNIFFLCFKKWPTLCMMGNFSCFCCHLLTFFKINLFKKFFQRHYQTVKLFSKVISRWQRCG